MPFLSGFPVGARNLAAGSQHAVSAEKWVRFSAGSVVTIAGVVLGISALGTALAVSGTGQWGHPPYEYKGDYDIMRLRTRPVSFRRLAAVGEGQMREAE